MKILFEIKKKDNFFIEVYEGLGDERAIHLIVNDNLLTLDLQRSHVKQLIKELQNFESMFDELEKY